MLKESITAILRVGRHARTPLVALGAMTLIVGCQESLAATMLPGIFVINDSTKGVSAGTSDVLILGTQSLSAAESFPESILTLSQALVCTDVRGRPARCTSVLKDVTLGLHEPGLIGSALSDILTLTITDGAVLGNGVVHVSYESDPGLTETALHAPFGGTTGTIEEKEDAVQNLTGALQTLATGGQVPEPSSLVLAGLGFLLGALGRRLRQRGR